MHKRMRRVALAVTAGVVVAIAGGVTYAVAQVGSGRVINRCYESVNGQRRLIDPATDSCHPSETPISWIPAPLTTDQRIRRLHKQSTVS